MGKREKDSYVIQAVASAFEILEEFEGQDSQLGVTELAARLDLHKNTAQRLLYTLENRGYIEMDRGTGNYRLGVRTLELAHIYVRKTDILSMATSMLNHIVEECNETAYLAVLREGRAVYVKSAESTHPVRVVSRVGKSFPLYCSAVGKVLLAFRPEEEAAELIKDIEFTAHTSHTITTPEALNAELEAIRQNGYSLSVEEFHEGICGLGYPVFDYTGRVVGAISISGPTYRFTDERIKEVLLVLAREAAEEMSRRLGFDLPKSLKD